MVFMETKRFQKNVEDFKCENCGAEVSGNGYTDHCPKCLYSKHVDVNPGDRAAECGGLMAPVTVERVTDGYKISYVCQKCGYLHSVKSAAEDDFEEIVNVAERQSKS